MIKRLLLKADRLAATVTAYAPPVLATTARLILAGVLLVYYWKSALTKIGDGTLGLFRPSLGAYAQIFPRQLEAVGFDVQELSIYHWAVVTAGTLAEFILPALLLIGLMSRPAALAMIGFVVVQSLTDIYGHHLDAAGIGRWFDGEPGALLVDQRSLWLLALLIIVMSGAGPLSVDRLLRRSVKP